MTSLQNLQESIIQEFLDEIDQPGTRHYYETIIKEITARVFESALQEALGKVPGEEDESGYAFQKQGSAGLTMWNACRTETIQGITSLFPKKDI